MLAVVKKPLIQLSLQGELTDELIDWSRKKFEVSIPTPDQWDSIPIEYADFWKEMQSSRVGNLLAGARLKAGRTQNMISDYERGKRRISSSMAKRISKAFHINVDRLS